MFCYLCDKEIDEIGQDNLCYIFGKVICEDCFVDMTDDDIDMLQELQNLD
jgi:hypothetical protein